MPADKVRKKTTAVNIAAIADIYRPDVMSDSESQYALKEKLQRLDEVDRRILMLYAEYQSLPKVAAILNVSTASVRLYINKIRQKWKEL